MQVARNLPRSRKNEFDADQRGLRTLTRAGYAQSAMPAFMQKLVSSKSSAPAFLSSHPATGDRINALENSINSQPTNQGQGLDNAAYRANIRPLGR